MFIVNKQKERKENKNNNLKHVLFWVDLNVSITNKMESDSNSEIKKKILKYLTFNINIFQLIDYNRQSANGNF